jgi:hypothetical protein
MNVEIGTEAAQFPEMEYINGFFVAVYKAQLISENLKTLVICDKKVVIGE